MCRLCCLSFKKSHVSVHCSLFFVPLLKRVSHLIYVSSTEVKVLFSLLLCSFEESALHPVVSLAKFDFRMYLFVWFASSPKQTVSVRAHLFTTAVAEAAAAATTYVLFAFR